METACRHLHVSAPIHRTCTSRGYTDLYIVTLRCMDCGGEVGNSGRCTFVQGESRAQRNFLERMTERGALPA